MKKFLLFLLCLAPLLRAEAPESSDEDAATAVEVSGAVFFETEASQLKPVEEGQLFAEGDHLVTKDDGSLHLALADGSTLSLGSNSELWVKSVGRGGDGSKTFFELLKGSVNAIVHKLSAGASFEVSTSNAVAAVKGTQFEVSAAEGADSAVTVQEGTVAMSDPDRKNTVLVPPLHRSVGLRAASRLSEREEKAFGQRWERARRVHARRAQLLKRFAGMRNQHRVALRARRRLLRQHLHERHRAASLRMAAPERRHPLAAAEARQRRKKRREHLHPNQDPHPAN